LFVNNSSRKCSIPGLPNAPDLPEGGTARCESERLRLNKRIAGHIGRVVFPTNLKYAWRFLSGASDDVLG
jgi:hypothetical protein